MLELVQPRDMPAIPGLAVPYDFYWVLQHPTPLAGMPYPSSRTPWPDSRPQVFAMSSALRGMGRPTTLPHSL